MAKSNPTRPDAPDDEAGTGGDSQQPFAGRGGPVLKDPRSVAAMDNIGIEEQGDLLDPELDEQPGDRDNDGSSFADDVRSDMGVRGGIRESGDT